ncbi:MAG: LysM peptidoglycan-binding domain-containing protein [Arcobacter sp.]|nr:LysM peptidoglycan-binding domain-containing protein [Arcobacter sp.]
MYCKDNDFSKNPKIQKYRKTLKDYENGKANYKAVNEIYQDVKTWDYKPSINELLTDIKGSNKPYVPKESQNYIKKIISLAMMNNDNFMKTNENKLLNRGNNSSLVRVDVGGGMLLKNIANLSGITPDKLKQLNPHIKTGETPPNENNSTQIYIPSSKLTEYNENKKNVKNNSGSETSLEPKAAKEMKNIKDDVENTQSDYVKKYVVQKGDNLYKIAKENGTTMAKLMKDNNMKTNKVKPGDKIAIQIK